MKKIVLLTLLVCFFMPVLNAQEKKDEFKMKPALLVIDVQKQYMPMMSKEDQEKAIQYMNWAIWVFRQHKEPIIRIYHKSEGYGVAPGTEGFEFHDSLNVNDEDMKVIKTYSNAFTKTDLDKILKENEINTLFMCGMSSTGCVLATYFGAKDYDYKAFLIKDALLGPKVKYTDNIEEIFSAIGLETMNFMIEISKD